MKPITRTEPPVTLCEVTPTELSLVHGGVMPPGSEYDFRPAPLKPVGPNTLTPFSGYRWAFTDAV